MSRSEVASEQDAVHGATTASPQYAATVAHIALGGTVLGLIALDPLSGGAGVADLAERCGFRPWDLHLGVLTPDPGWIVAFTRHKRALYTIGRTEHGVIDLTLYQANTPVEIPAATWGAFRSRRGVVVCGGISGKPTRANLMAAAAAGRLHAATARRYLR